MRHLLVRPTAFGAGLNLIKFCLAAAAAVAAACAPADAMSVTAGAYSTQAGSLTHTFDAGTGIALDRLGGARYTSSTSSVTAVPTGSTGNFWSSASTPSLRAPRGGPPTAGLRS